MSFDYYLANECLVGVACAFDKLTLEVSTNAGGTWTVLQTLANNSSVAGTFTPVTQNMAAYAGLNTQVRFQFNTVDGACNTFEGAYIDNVKLQ